VHDHELEHVDGGSLRPKVTRLEDPESVLQGSFVQRTEGEKLDEEPRNPLVASLLKPVQRSACGPGCGCGPCAEETTEPGVPVQRHQGVDSSREKPRLESAGSRQRA
jgi:hypothetical protein